MAAPDQKKLHADLLDDAKKAFNEITAKMPMRCSYVHTSKDGTTLRCPNVGEAPQHGSYLCQLCHDFKEGLKGLAQEVYDGFRVIPNALRQLIEDKQHEIHERRAKALFTARPA